MDTSSSDSPDSAGIFAAALSLWLECERLQKEKSKPFENGYANGRDQLMRDMMAAAQLFESWACKHVYFDELNEVWPYLLEEHFGPVCLAEMPLETIGEFNQQSCMEVAIALKIPLRLDSGLIFPINLQANVGDSQMAFRKLRICTVRTFIEDGSVECFCWHDVNDGEWSTPYYGVYGIDGDDSVEHIADRNSYLSAVSLAQKLSPSIDFPMHVIGGI
ncbi:MAG: hypothetical protein QM796_20925 [Chthoniobacteraceae bacterium]